MYEPIPGGSCREIGYDDQWHTVQLPPVGKVFNKLSGKLERRKVLFSDRPLKERKWKRTPLPKEWKQWRKEEKVKQRSDPNWEHPEVVKFAEQEWDRRINGVWIEIYNPSKNCSELLYLTGMHYYHLNWMKFQGFENGYPDFRVVDVDVFQLLGYAIENPKCTGLLMATLRRFGKTAILGTFILDYVSRTPHTHGGLQSLTLTDAKKVYTANIFYPFKNLPDFFKPKYDYKTMSSLKFSEPPNTSRSALDYDPEEDNNLYSEIDYRESSPFAYDGWKVHRYGLEEPGKAKDVDVNERYNITKPCAKVGPRIVGKFFGPTTIEEMEQGGEKFLELWNRSQVTTEGYYKYGQTDSQLITLFIPAYRGYIFDEYGWSQEEEAKEELMKEREGATNKKDLADIIRKYPWTFEEATMLSTDQCVFNSYILTTRMREVEKMAKRPYEKFNLRWRDKVDGPVEAIRDDNGKFWFSWFPEPATYFEGQVTEILNNVYERTRVVDGKYRTEFAPKNDHLFTIGTDPISYTKTDNPRASRAATYAFRKFDPALDLGKDREDWESYMFFMEYIHRPSDPNEYFEDMIMLCRFLGCSILPEAQKTDILKHFDDRGYGDFVVYRHDFKDKHMKGGKNNTAGVPATKEIIDSYTSELTTFYERHGHRVPFDRLLEQSLRFDPLKTTKYDATVAAGWTLLSLRKIIVPVVEHVNTEGWFDEIIISPKHG